MKRHKKHRQHARPTATTGTTTLVLADRHPAALTEAKSAGTRDLEQIARTFGLMLPAGDPWEDGDPAEDAEAIRLERQVEEFEFRYWDEAGDPQRKPQLVTRALIDDAELPLGLPQPEVGCDHTYLIRPDGSGYICLYCDRVVPLDEPVEPIGEDYPINWTDQLALWEELA